MPKKSVKKSSKTLSKHAKSRAQTIQARLKHIFRLEFSGAVLGLLFLCLSFTPSLLPRTYFLQAVASALSFATGYGLGVGIAHFYHLFPAKYQPKLPMLAKRVTLSILGLLAIIFMFLGQHWQEQIRVVTEAAPAGSSHLIRVIIIAAILAFLLIWMGRGIARLGRFVGRQLDRFLPHKVSVYGGALLTAVLLIFLVNGVLLKGLFGVINFTFGLANKGTPDGIYQPQSSIYSGSPASAIDWNSLGEKGREFVAKSTPPADISKFSRSKASTPSRLYVGLESAPTLNERVNLLVKELQRTHAEQREAVLIAIPTGSGGINNKSVESVEYLYDGNTSSLGIQYSYLPSWLSFLADQETARQTGKAVTEAVYDWWNGLNPAHRPKLLMYGESLGTLGADGAFSGPSDIHNRMYGVLLVGPPNANQLWRDIVDERDAATREVLPTYQQGSVVRFSDEGDGFTQPADKNWQPNRVGIVQNASDPVVWASTSLFIHEPDWLREPRGSDVLSNMHWYPFVTAWQVGLDLPFAFGATLGHGHRYDNDLAASWIGVLNIKLSSEKTNQLKQIINTDN